jgi:hypothetical protein
MPVIPGSEPIGRRRLRDASRSPAPQGKESPMPARSNSPNHFLASLSPRDYELLQPHLRPIELPQGLVLYVPRTRSSGCIFRETG